MTSSVDKLVSNFDDNYCQNLREIYKVDTVFKLMRQKSLYPCENIWRNLNKKKLPAKNIFYSKKNMKSISDHDYDHAAQVWMKILPEENTMTFIQYML